MKTYLLLLAFLVFGCATQRPLETPPEVEAPKVETPAPKVEVPAPIEEKPEQKTIIKVSVSSLSGFSVEGEERFKKIAARLEKIINSPEFKSKVLAHGPYVDTKDTPEEIYKKITSKDWNLEYRLEWLWRKSTVGYTYPNVSWIALNSRLFWGLEDKEIASNICHEFGGHKLGRYDHSAQWTPERDRSVPYGLGFICETLYGKASN